MTDIIPRCTNLCGGHLSIKGKVSLFAVSLLSQTGGKHSTWQARKGKNSTCQIVQNTTAADESFVQHTWKRMGMHWCACQLQVSVDRKAKKKNREEKKRQLKRKQAEQTQRKFKPSVSHLDVGSEIGHIFVSPGVHIVRYYIVSTQRK